MAVLQTAWIPNETSSNSASYSGSQPFVYAAFVGVRERTSKYQDLSVGGHISISNMGLTRRTRSRGHHDHLLVLDENDHIKLCGQQLKTVLEETHLCRITQRGLLDDVAEASSLQWDKMIIIRAGTEHAEHEQMWLDTINSRTGKHIEHLSLYLCPDAEVEKAVRATVGQPVESEHILICQESDVMEWFSKIVEFLFDLRCPNLMDAPGCGFLAMLTESSSGKQFQKHTKEVLQAKGIIDETPFEGFNTVVILCDKLSQRVDKATKEKLRQKKLGGCRVYALSLSHDVDISDDMSWIASRTYTREKIPLFVLHLYQRLGIIHSDTLLHDTDPPRPVAGTVKVGNRDMSTGSLLIEWPQDQSRDVGGQEFLHIQHRTNSGDDWVTLTSGLPGSASSYEVSGLETSCGHQFRVVRETAAGLSRPLASPWFFWYTRSPCQLPLKIFYWLCCIVWSLILVPQLLLILTLIVLIFAVIIALTLLKGVVLNPHFIFKHKSPIYLVYCLLMMLPCFIVYGIYQQLVWLLPIGIYIVAWCLGLHFLLVYVLKDELGTLALPGYLLDEANDTNEKIYPLDV